MRQLSELIAKIVEEEISEKKINPNYLTRDAKKMRSEIQKQAKKSDDDPSAYTSHPKGQWKADYNSKGEKYKTKPSKWTKKLQKMKSEKSDEGHAIHTLGMLQEAAIEHVAYSLDEGLGKTVMKALRNKAELTNAPLGAITTVYRKGMAAWKTGHRPGVSQHQWAMGRVNSFLGGGKARKVDAAQWARVKQYRKRHKKSD
jgi:hypothetical protein